jgi:diaminobutyrate-2-oxoglutarate transaminase
MKPVVSLCRLDGFIDLAGRYRILETNTACPGGVVQAGLAARLWQQLAGRVGAGITIDQSAQPLVQHPAHFATSLAQAYMQLRGERAHRAAVTNYNGKYTNEVHWIVSGLRGLGIEADLVDAQNLRRDGAGGLHGPTGRIDLVYNKLDPLDLIDNGNLREYLQAAVHDDIAFLSPLIAQWILEDKAILAVLTDPRFEGNFTPAQRRLFEEHVPWTRFCRESTTTDSEGSITDLLELVRGQRRSLVLKPTNASRGDGVTIGRTVTEAEWLDKVNKAFASGRYVVQELVDPRQVLVPDAEGTELHPMNSGLDVFVMNGRFAGFHSRASIDPVINIGRRGLLLPVLVPQEI